MWKQLSPEGELTAEQVRHRNRALSIFVDGDGMYVVRGRLEPEAGAVLMRALEAAADALYRREERAGEEVRQEKRIGAPLHEEVAPPEGTRAREAATLAEEGEPGRSDLDGVRVAAETSRRMACDAAVVEMVGRKTRTVPPHIRRALEERDRGCRFPGVRKPLHRSSPRSALG